MEIGRNGVRFGLRSPVKNNSEASEASRLVRRGIPTTKNTSARAKAFVGLSGLNKSDVETSENMSSFFKVESYPDMDFLDCRPS